MKRLAVFLIALAGGAGAASAQTGAGCLNPGQSGAGGADSAVAACTARIQSGADAGASLALDFEARARAYFQRDDCRDHGACDLAIGDLTRAIALDPDHGQRFLDERAQAYERNGAHGQYQLAVADYIGAIKRAGSDPQYGTTSDSYAGFYLGRDEFIAGRYSDAAADLALFMKDPDAGDPEYVGDFEDAILWLHLARARAGTPDAAELSRNVSLMTRVEPWMAEIYRLYLGQSTPNKVFSAAGEIPAGDASAAVARCYANFFIGEYELLRKDASAPGWLSDTASSCTRKDRDKVLADAAAADMSRYAAQ